VIEVIRHPRDKVESKYNPDVGMTKEDEERYQKLVAENEELQKLISAVRLLTFHSPVVKCAVYTFFFQEIMGCNPV
jgi:hypothetical protein